VKSADEKLIELRSLLRSWGSVAVAYSGGTDSGLLLTIAREELGDRAVAFMIISPSFPEHERREARALATEIGAELIEIFGGEMDLEEYVRNGPDRCYHCKKMLLSKIKDEAKRKYLDSVIDGTNADDLTTSRQGLRALHEMGARSPLADVGLTKSEIRSLASTLGLANADRPSTACLASRIPFGERITEERLEQVERAEGLLRSIGLRQLRVRHHGHIARIEVELDDIGLVVKNKAQIVKGFREIGFKYVCLDLEGFRSGSMDETLEKDRVRRA
jgi:uncharacterized protein